MEIIGRSDLVELRDTSGTCLDGGGGGVLRNKGLDCINGQCNNGGGGGVQDWSPLRVYKPVLLQHLVYFVF